VNSVNEVIKQTAKTGNGHGSSLRRLRVNQYLLGDMIRSGKYFILSFLLMALLVSAALGESRLGVYGGGGSRSISGEIQLESGFGLEVGLIIPFSDYLDLFGSVILPRKYDVAKPEGQTFSTGNYERTYSSLQFAALSAGMLFIGKFYDDQEYLPVVKLAFGKSWIYGSGNDGLTGADIEFGAGVRYVKDRHWSFQFLASRMMIDFTKLKVNGDSDDIPTDESSACTSLIFSAHYTFSLGID